LKKRGKKLLPGAASGRRKSANQALPASDKSFFGSFFQKRTAFSVHCLGGGHS
jgi:hypothetical protein